MNDMFLVLEKTSDLMEVIKQSDVYLEYEKALCELEKYPELKTKADDFRRENFVKVNSLKTPVSFTAIADMEARYNEVSVYPQIVRYLNAELALCRLVQRIQNSLASTITL